MDADETAEQISHVIAIRVRSELHAIVERAGALEGLSKADVVRRAVLRDLARADGNGHG